MADDLTLNAGSGGSNLKTDQTGGASGPHYQIVKLADGTADATTVIAAGGGVEANALRVTIASDSTGVLTVDNGGTFAVQSTLQAGTAEFGKLAAGVAEIGNVKNSGTFATQAAQSGTWNITNVSGTVSLPTGASTAANQSTGNTSLSAIQTATELGNDPVFADDAAFTLASSKVMMSGAVRDDALSTLTAIEGDSVPLRVGATGALHVTGGGGGTEYTEDVATPAPIVGTATMMERDDVLSTLTPVAGDWVSFRSTAEGALWTQDFNSDAHLTAQQAIQTAVEGTLTVGSHEVTNGGTFAVQSTLQAGTAAFGKLAANSGVDIGDVDVTSISAGSNLIGDVGLSGARTSGGTTAYRNIDVDETEDDIKTSAGQVYWIHAVSIDATPVYLHLYNATAANVTVGTTAPHLTFLVPTQGDSNGAGFTLSIPNGVAFGTAISIAATTTVGGTAGPGLNEVIVNLGYA